MKKASLAQTSPTPVPSGTERFIPLNKLKKSPRNARKTAHSEASIEAKAASIAAKGILQNLVVEPERDATGAETGFYFVTIGEGRRLAQLLRAKRKQIRKTEPVRCVIDTSNDPHEISLDENVTREAMHPADQFEAFRDLAQQQGWGAQEIAARFGVSAHVVRQRLRLGAVSPRLMQCYRDGELTLDQLMAFALVADHARQEEVYDNLAWNRDASAIRRELTQGHVATSDRRALFVGLDAYRAAGGTILRDLFTEDGGGYCEDAALLDRLAMAKLDTVATTIRQEGWKWASVHIDYPYAHGMRRSYPEAVELTAGDEVAYEAASAAYEALWQRYEDEEAGDLPEAAAARLAGLDAELERLDALRRVYSADDMARGGAFVVLSHDGTVRVERGFIRADDDLPNTGEDTSGVAGDAPDTEPQAREADDSLKLPDLLIRNLTAHRTLGLRLALGEQPDIALLAVTHTLAAQAFFPDMRAPCLDLRSGSTALDGLAIGLADTALAQAVTERHAAWASAMPRSVTGLWEFVTGLDPERRMALFAHCASLTVDAVQQAGERRPQADDSADRLAVALQLDMADHWTPAGRAYLDRVTKAHILAAVREGVDGAAADRLSAMKKGPMAVAAAGLLAGRRWLPALLRTPSCPVPPANPPEAQHGDTESAVAA